MADVTDKLLSKAEEAFCSFTELMSNKVVKVISRYRIFLFGKTSDALKSLLSKTEI